MPLERSDVEHIAILARIGLTDEEVELFRDQLSGILEQFEVLRELNTTDVAPTGHAAQLSRPVTALRDDAAEDSLATEEVLSNAPLRKGALFRVKVVLAE